MANNYSGDDPAGVPGSIPDAAGGDRDKAGASVVALSSNFFFLPSPSARRRFES